jgi:hypothetical protein
MCLTDQQHDWDKKFDSCGDHGISTHLVNLTLATTASDRLR